MKSIIFLLSLTIIHIKGGTFNYEVGARVKDKITDYLEMISKAGSLPITIVNQGTVDLTDGMVAAPTIFYPSMVHYDGKITNFYFGLETGYFVLYGHQASEGEEIYFDQTIFFDSAWHGVRYYTNLKTGVPLEKTGYNNTYDCRVRPWYKSVKEAKIARWSSPYLDLFTSLPLLSYMSPILNYTLNGTFYDFAGTTAADIYLSDIANFLVDAYGDTDRKVFIVDRLTNYLIANSWGAATSKTTENGLDFVLVSESTDNLVSGPYLKLSDHGFPDELLIYDDYYLQSILYEDGVSGLEWYIVILLPAVVEVDHLGPDSILYTISLVLIAIAGVIGVTSIGITIYCRKTKIVKLSKPFFTYLILIGGLFLCALTYFCLGANTEPNCAIRIYLFSFAFSLTFAPLLIKSWNVHMLFNYNPLSKKTALRNQVFLFWTLVFIIIDVVLTTVTLHTSSKNSASNGTDPVTITKLSTNGAYSELTYCGYYDNNHLAYSQFIHKGSLIGIACYLSFRTRNVVDAIAGSKTLLVIVYNIAVLVIIAMVINTSVSDNRVAIFSKVVCICIVVVANAILLVLPWLYQLVVHGDDEAAAMILDGIFLTAPTSTNKLKRNNSNEEIQSRLDNNEIHSSIHPKHSIILSTASTFIRPFIRDIKSSGSGVFAITNGVSRHGSLGSRSSTTRGGQKVMPARRSLLSGVVDNKPDVEQGGGGGGDNPQLLGGIDHRKCGSDDSLLMKNTNITNEDDGLMPQTTYDTKDNDRDDRSDLDLQVSPGIECRTQAYSNNAPSF